MSWYYMNIRTQYPSHVHMHLCTRVHYPHHRCVVLYYCIWLSGLRLVQLYTGLTSAPVPDPRLGLGPSEWVWELKLAVLPLRPLHHQAAGQGHSTGNG